MTNAATEQLDAQRIRTQVAAARAARLHTLQVHAQIDSTNASLLRSLPPPAGHFAVCLAEYQSAGEGRLGRSWASANGTGLCLSLSARLASATPDLSALSLAVGIAVCAALSEAGITGVALKWPNDLLCDGRKLGGILLQAKNVDAHTLLVVLGIGLNVTAVPAALATGALPATRLIDVPGGAHIARNALAGRLIDHLIQCIDRFERDGFAAFAGAWDAADTLRDKAVRVRAEAGDLHGVARGVAADGALLVETSAGVQRVVAGDVSVRLGDGS